jgi:mRNA interferase RelE/StbE
MPYAVHLKRSAEKELEGLPEKVHRKIIERLLSLKDDPRPPGCKKL